MSEFIIPGSDAAANALFQQFEKAMDQYAETLGFNVADTASCTAAVTGFNSALGDSTDAKAAAKAAVLTKDQVRRTSSSTIRGLAQRVKTNPEATNEIKAAFGLNVNPSPGGNVQVPTNLSATAQSNGVAKLKWRANGNIRSTIYLIEVETASGWLLYGSSSKTNFVDNAATPGVQKTYRVRAQRSNLTSPPSNEAVIYSGAGGNSSLSLAA
jgi:hypothetical protein